MGKNILEQRRGRGFFIFRAPTHRRLHLAGYNSVNGHSTGFVRELLHEVARGAPHESGPETVPTKVARTEMAVSQRPSNDRSVPPPRWRKTQTRREAYDCRSRYTSWKKSRQHRRSPDRTGKASLGAIDPRNILILQVESNMTQYG